MPPKVNSTILYVGSIPFDWDEETVKSVICGSGNVVDVRLGFDYAGKNKGFCFVEYQTIRDAQRAFPLLNQITVFHNNHPKKLRIESSKEGFQKGGPQPPSDQRPILQLNRNKLPDYVRLPQEMLMYPSGNRISNSPIPTNIPMKPHRGGPGPGPRAGPGPVPVPGPITTGPAQPMPTKLTNATKTLQQPLSLPFAITDKINETLSKIPPVQLIELIANLKNMLSGPDAHRVMDVFQMSPNFAASAAQALLLMGFIDSDVISESMKSASSTPQPVQVSTPSIPTPVAVNPAYNQPTYHAPPPPSTLYSNPYGLPIPASQQQQQQQYQFQQQQQPPQQQLYQQQPISKWPHLPLETQRKLLARPPDQAELMAQVLSLPPDQINSLPPDKQEMVKSLRAEYL
ncbi:uncharacterized protein J8A68_002520 [[Candida] subhashii]|uniref:RRM domain-containing protein n=1 Tax=[Candida] subhashii TaxID=561895 RepID=A0A8J5QD03_9ASCO|nr:uncharacterized protein J8A68_002520 [[Candida] subhashii]KAG7663959.1 hypothetical protein J8A68_002520 [[Candida] subhashii]